MSKLKKYLLFTLLGLCIAAPQVIEASAADEAQATGTIFAGYYEDEAYTIPSEVETEYLKYVDSSVLGIKVQTKTNDDGTTDMRVVSTVDSADYKRLGFDIWFAKAGTAIDTTKTPVNYETGTVYKRIKAKENGVDYNYSPKIQDVDSKYFATGTIEGILTEKHKDSNFYIRPYWITFDGTKVYGESKCVSVSDGENNNINMTIRTTNPGEATSIPVQIDTTAYNATVKFWEDGYACINIPVEDKTKLPSANLIEVAADSSVYLSDAKEVYRNTELTFDGNADTSWYEVYTALGETKFTIATAADFEAIQQIANGKATGITRDLFADKTIYLVNDIVINTGNVPTLAKDTGNDLHVTMPIGDVNNAFAGIFDGQGHTISGFYVYGTQCIGVFGQTAAGSQVQNFKIENSYFRGGNSVGSVVGYNCAGTFDGIESDATIEGTDGTGVYVGGLFGYVKSSATVQNCAFTGELMNDTSDTTFHPWNTMTGNGAFNGGIIGGIVNVSVDIENCYFGGTVNGAFYVGGIVGYINGNANSTVNITNCLSDGILYGTNQQVGGIIGSTNIYDQKTTISESLSVSDISAYASGRVVGTVVGYQNYGSIQTSNVYGYNRTSATTGTQDVLGGSNASYVGEGKIYVATTATQVTLDTISGISAYTGTELIFDRPETEKITEGSWVITDSTPELGMFSNSENALLLGQFREDTAWADASADGKYYISRPEELLGLASLVNATDSRNFAGETIYLSNDIVINTGDVPALAKESTNDLHLTLPIGNAKKAFGGTFDGQGHTISGLYVYGSQCIGFFGQTAAGSQVKNFKIENSYFRGGNSVGSVVGFNCAGTFDGIASNAVVEGTDGLAYYVGGLFGYTEQSATIQNCAFTGTVTNNASDTSKLYDHTNVKGTNGAFNGGIIGGIYATSVEIQNCYFGGTVNGAFYVGGIVGHLNLTKTVNISHCLSDGTLYATNQQIGGMIGATNITDKTTTISDSLSVSDISAYATGRVLGTIMGYQRYGGVATSNVYGYNAHANSEEQEILGLYHNDATTNSLTITTATQITDITTLHDISVFVNSALNAENWTARVGTTPMISVFAEEADYTQVPKVGSSYAISKELTTNEDGAYVINSPADLYGFALLSQSDAYANQTIVLSGDIAVNPVEIHANDKNTVYYKWLPIGNTGNAFAGTFDGVDYTIHGLYAKGTQAVGLFAQTTTGSQVKNFKIKNSWFEGTKGVGSVVGLSGTGTFDSIESNAVVKGVDGLAINVGGLIGSAGGATIQNCAFTGSVINDTSDKTTHTLGEEHTCNDQLVNGTYNGGIVGIIDAKTVTIENCYFGGDIQGAYYVGGIVGFVRNVANSSTTVQINHCLSAGDIYGTNQQIGGIVGAANFNAKMSVTLSDSLSTSKVYSYAKYRVVGSVVGYQIYGNITTQNVYGYCDTSVTYGASDILGGKSNYIDGTTLVAVTANKISDITMLFDADAFVNSSLSTEHWTARVDNYPMLTVFATAGNYANPAVKNASYVIDTDIAQENGAYQITSVAELYGFAFLSQTNDYAGATVTLADNITVNNASIDLDDEEAVYYKWLQIGSTDNPFAGTFNGQGNVIKGIYRAGSTYIGLFTATADSSKLTDFRLEDSYFKATSHYIGSIAAIGNGTFEKIYSNAVVVNNDGDDVVGEDGAGNDTGGLIGYIDTDSENNVIEQCWFNGKVEAESYVAGGLVSEVKANSSVTIKNSLNSGTVDSAHRRVGGIVGVIGGTVEIANSMNTGDIYAQSRYGTEDFGSIVGYVSSKGTVDMNTVYGVNDFASEGVAYFQSVTDETTGVTTTGTKTGDDVLMSTKRDRLMAYAGTTANAKFAEYWSLMNEGTPVLSYFVGDGNVKESTEVYNKTITEIDALLELDYWNDSTNITMNKAEEKGVGNYLLTISGKDKTAYGAYCQALEDGIFKAYNNDNSTDLNTEGVYNTIYTSANQKETDPANDDWVVNVTYVDGTIYISVNTGQPLSEHLTGEVDYTAKEGFVDDGYTAEDGAITDTTFHMLEMEYYSAACYVMQLKNGHFVVIDGGMRGNAERLISYIEGCIPDKAVDAEGNKLKPIIEAWVVSHAHEDHAGAIMKLTELSDYVNKIYIEGFYFNEPSESVLYTYANDHHQFVGGIKRATNIYKTSTNGSPEIYRMTTGQRYTFDDVIMDVMMSQEVLTNYSAANNDEAFNDTSTWTMFTIDDKKLLTAGDASDYGTRFINSAYSSSYPTVDVFTALHHGINTSRYSSISTFQGNLTVKGVVLYAYQRDWRSTTHADDSSAVKDRNRSFISGQSDLAGVATTYADGSTGTAEYLYFGQGTSILTFGDTIAARVLPKVYGTTTTTE